MEIILAIVVAAAVIFFGALISLGNERQSKSIDDLRQQITQWAVQDLRIKRINLTHSVNVPDPLEWFREIISRFYGDNLNLQVVESSDDPQFIVFTSSGRNHQIICTPLSPKDIRKIKYNKRSRLRSYPNHNRLVSMPQNMIVHECSVINSGVLFDLELSLAWKGLTGKVLNTKDFLWVYII